MAGGLGLVAAVVFGFWGQGGGGDDPTPGGVDSTSGVGARPSAWSSAEGVGLPSGPDQDEVARLASASLPSSLAGTDPDGGLSIGEDGRLIPTPDALALFDYYLAASGEEPPAVVRARILGRIRALATPPADREAEALLERYLAFREDVRALAQAGDVPGDLERRLQWIRELRRAHFGADAEALFGRSEQVARVDLERRRVALDPGLDERERAARLEALEAELPESTRLARRRARAPAGVQREVEALREQGASDEQVFALRERRFGTEAAERLAGLDAEQQAWRERLAAYRAERDLLLESPDLAALDPEERSRALEALRAEHFSRDELRRVRALDRPSL